MLVFEKTPQGWKIVRDVTITGAEAIAGNSEDCYLCEFLTRRLYRCSCEPVGATQEAS